VAASKTNRTPVTEEVKGAVKKGCWPFFWHVQDGRWYVNKAKQRSRADEVKHLGEAKW
jgi:hypothetical protein